jgi:hypothetical protein
MYAFRDTLQKLIQKGTNSEGIFPDVLRHFALEEVLDYDGAQGKVGILKHLDTKVLLIFKIPLRPSCFTRHEYNVMEQFHNSRKYFPHLCLSYGLIKTPVSYTNANPFETTGGTVLAEVLLSEYVQDSRCLSELEFREEVSLSIFKRVLLTVQFYQRNYGMTHYDLHSDNVLIKKCPRKTIALYLSEKKATVLPTYGYVPIVIDFGFAYMKKITDLYAKNEQGYPLYSPMNHTSAGYLGCIYDQHYDTRVFLINTIPEETEEEEEGVEVYRQRIKGLFAHQTTNFEKGWDNRSEENCAALMVIYTIEDLEKEQSRCPFIVDNSYDVVTILQELINIPLKNKQNGDLRPFYKQFAPEFEKFVSTVTTVLSRLTILRVLVEAAREVRELGESAARTEKFRTRVLHQIDLSLAYYVPPEKVDYGLLLSSLYGMTECIETIYFRVLTKILKQKREQYRRSLSVAEIYDYLDTCYPHRIELCPDSSLHVYDTDDQLGYTVKSFTPEFCARVNRSEHQAELLQTHVTELRRG